MQTGIPASFIDVAPALERDHEAILSALEGAGYLLPDWPTLPACGDDAGTAAARAYPIQGILKYHGMADWHWRTAYFPSISLNNDAAYTLTMVTIDPTLEHDRVVINGAPAGGRETERVIQVLDEVRRLAHTPSRAQVVSRNVLRAGKTGKGLGTSASASAALASAALEAVFGPEIASHPRLLSCTARLLAGSGCRSAAGGVSLWLSYPSIPHEDCFAVRLDAAAQLEEMRLITVPVDSRIGLQTEMAHRDAPASPFFRAWMASRREEVLECIAATRTGDWRTLGQWAELDSIRLHSVTMSGSRENKLFAWEPENIAVFRLCNDLRSSRVPVYFSTDTGPTTVLLTHRDHEGTVAGAVEALGLGLEAVRGRIAGPVQRVDVESAREELGA